MNGRWRRRGEWFRRLGWLGWAALAVAALGQAAHTPAHSPAQTMTPAVAPSVLAAGAAQDEVVREIDDPECGTRWLLLRDGRNPGGPGRLVLAQGAGGANGTAKTHGSTEAFAELDRLKPVIRPGDRLVIEQETPVVSARLEAVALGPAAAGKTFKARLRMGGKIVEAVALAPGRATLEPEARP